MQERQLTAVRRQREKVVTGWQQQRTTAARLKRRSGMLLAPRELARCQHSLWGASCVFPAHDIVCSWKFGNTMLSMHSTYHYRCGHGLANTHLWGTTLYTAVYMHTGSSDGGKTHHGALAASHHGLRAWHPHHVPASRCCQANVRPSLQP